MAKSCVVTGKAVSTGNNISHSKQKTRRRMHPNLQTRRLVNPATGRIVTVTVSTRGLRTLKKWDLEGRKYDLKALGAL